MRYGMPLLSKDAMRNYLRMNKDNKIRIEITPYNAISILSFCREFINEDTPNKYHFQAIREAVDELELQLGRILTDEHFEEIRAENELNKLIGKIPP